MTPVIIIGAPEQAAIAAAVASAAAHPIPLSIMRRIADRSLDVRELVAPVQSLMLTTGLSVTFTIEEHPMGWCRHISVGIASRPPHRRKPHPLIVEFIMKEFGMDGRDDDCSAYLESGETYIAQNVIEHMSPADAEPFRGRSGPPPGPG